MHCLQLAAEHVTGGRLEFGLTISDNCDGLRTGMGTVHTEEDAASRGRDEQPKIGHAGDWAHIATKYKRSKLIPKSNPYYDRIYYILKTVHVAHSFEMQTMLTDVVKSVFMYWEQFGEPQPGK